mgnify:CR=1 FL=1
MSLLFFSIAGSEIFLVVLVVVLLFGSKKIPDLARSFGKGIREFKNATGDIQDEIRRTSQEITDSADPAKKSSKQSNSSTER